MITRPTIPGPDPDTKPPSFKAPPGAADCHFHVFGPEAEYPYAEPRRYTPPQVLESDYRKMADVLGLTRGVVVQASPYGADNARVLEAIRVLGPGYVGVGVVEASVPEERLDELNRLGIRGTRINSASGGRSGIERMSELAAKIKGFGWHMQFHIHAGQLPEYEQKIRKLPVDAVFDHMGLFPADMPLAHPDFRLLLRLLESGNVWVKLSGAERISRLGFPYRDAIPVARALIAAAPERVVWGTDWPHTNVRPAIPNDGDLMDLLIDFAPRCEGAPENTGGESLRPVRVRGGVIPLSPDGLKGQLPSFSLSISCRALGFALPPVAFIAWPTKKPMSFVFPPW